jgi:nucleotide-binding universal stress UspA family protein
MKIRRILVALDASPPSVAALEAAVDLAERLNAELRGLFVEDINLLRLAELPIAREMRFPRASAQRLDATQMAAQLRGQAAQAERRLQELAVAHKLSHSFSVARGPVAAALLAATLESDLLVLGHASHALVRADRLGSTAQTAVTQAERSVLLIHPKADLSLPPLLIYDGSPAAERALAVAITLVGENGRLFVLILAPNGDLAQQQLDQIEARLAARHINAAYRRLYGVHLPELLQLIQAAENSLLILSDRYEQLPLATLRQLAESVTCPVLVVR